MQIIKDELGKFVYTIPSICIVYLHHILLISVHRGQCRTLGVGMGCRGVLCIIGLILHASVTYDGYDHFVENLLAWNDD